MALNPAESREELRLRAVVTIGLGLAFLAGVLCQIGFLNGPSYWKWPWRNLDVWSVSFYFAAALGPILFALRRASADDSDRNSTAILAWLVGGSIILQFAGSVSEPGEFPFFEEIVRSPVATSYYSDAASITRFSDYLAEYHRTTRGLHSSTHPPGPILFYYLWLEVAGPSWAAILGGCAVGLIASIGVPVMFAFTGLWTAEPRTRYTACFLYALAPGLTLFFPEFDQTYPLLTMAMILCWVRALDGSTGMAALLGVVLSVATFFAYQLLAVGIFLALYAAYFFIARGPRPPALRRILSAGTLALGVVLVFYGILRWTSGFDAIGSFVQAASNQKSLAQELDRPYPQCIFFDLYDFLLGGGVMLLPLCCCYGTRAWSSLRSGNREAVLSLIGLGTILAVAATGLLRTETARVWLFLQPLAMVVAACELARWPLAPQQYLYVLQWATIVALKSRMTFIQP